MVTEKSGGQMDRHTHTNTETDHYNILHCICVHARVNRIHTDRVVVVVIVVVIEVVIVVVVVE